MTVTKVCLSPEPESKGTRRGGWYLHLFLIMTVGRDDVSCA